MSWRKTAGAARERLRNASLLRRAGRLASVTLIAGFAQGCASPPAPFIGPDPSDASAPAPMVNYRSTIGSYASLRPAEPSGWKERNEQAARATGKHHHGHAGMEHER